jgi:hypothetical protein
MAQLRNRIDRGVVRRGGEQDGPAKEKIRQECSPARCGRGYDWPDVKGDTFSQMSKREILF